MVLVNGDTVDESQETFFLDISNVQNATVGTSRGNGFIVDDDGPTISINDVSVTEGNAGTKAATFTLTLSGPSVSPSRSGQSQHLEQRRPRVITPQSTW